MKRDLNLCRDYLLDMAGEKEVRIDTPSKVHLYHTALLYDADLIDNNYSLTMKGHDVVSLIRDKDTWDYIMSASDSVGGLPFDMILEYAKESLVKKVDEVVKDKEAVDDDSGFVKKELQFTAASDERFAADNVGYTIADAYLLAKDGLYQSALLKLNSYIRNGVFSNNTIELWDYCADEVKLLLDYILDKLA